MTNLQNLKIRAVDGLPVSSAPSGKYPDATWDFQVSGIDSSIFIFLDNFYRITMLYIPDQNRPLDFTLFYRDIVHMNYTKLDIETREVNGRTHIIIEDTIETDCLEIQFRAPYGVKNMRVDFSSLELYGCILAQSNNIGLISNDVIVSLSKRGNYKWKHNTVNEVSIDRTHLFRDFLQFTIIYPPDVTCNLEEDSITNSLSFQFGVPKIEVVLQGFDIIRDSELNYHINMSIELYGDVTSVQEVKIRANQLVSNGSLTLACQKVDILSTSDPESLTRSVDELRFYITVIGCVLLGVIIISLIVIFICLKLIFNRNRDVKNELAHIRWKKPYEVK